MRISLVGVLVAAFLPGPADAQSRPLKILFLGDNAGHQPPARFRQLQPVLSGRGIELTYTDKLEALSPKVLGGYDGLFIYANHTKIAPDQEKALLDFAESGKAFIPVHCASYCFLNSPRYIELVGAQFKRHGTGVFRTTLTEAGASILKGYKSFESWDETYVHHKHNDKDRTVLEVRDEGGQKEPWTWIRTPGKARVFYTAWGHDERTWSNAGFHDLIERGIRWAAGAEAVAPAVVSDAPPTMTALRKDTKPFEYIEAKVPFYPPSKKWGVQSEPVGKMQKPVDADESVKHMVTPVGFEPRLYAGDPQIRRPLCMNWDERGRLWIAETVDYPNNLQREGEGHDRIVICEDTDGDGKADKFTVFADKLSIPTSFVFANGGIIVTQAPHTLFLRSTKGDDLCDERKVLFSGWGTRDTHAGPSNLRYGFDNWIYGICGYSGFRGEVGGEYVSFQQGFFRFKPDGSKMEFLGSTSNNSWGVGFSEDGSLFGSTANGNPSVHLAIPNRYYEKVRGWSSSVLPMISDTARMYPITEKVRQVDHHGNFTAGAGHALYTARAYPKQYWNRTAFVTEPTGHVVATFQIWPSGGTYRTRNSWNLLASDDEWTAPTMAEVGPDGLVWVIDWYNYIVQHNPTPAGFKTGKGNAYETPLRDKTHGRVYRLTYKDAPPPLLKSLKDMAPEQLVNALRSDNQFWRMHAQRLLVERGKADVLPELKAILADTSIDAIGLNGGATHALWTIDGLGQAASCQAEIIAALKHPSAGVRRNALAVLPRNSQAVDAVLAAGVLSDRDLQVRLAALLALADAPSDARAASAVLASLQMPELDRILFEATTVAAAAHDIHFLELAIDDKTPPAPAAFVERIAEHYARGGPVETVGQLLRQIRKAKPEGAAIVVHGLARGWPAGKSLAGNADVDDALVGLLKSLPGGELGDLVKLGRRLGSKALEEHIASISADFLKKLRNEKLSDSERSAAAAQFIDLRKDNPAAASEVLGLVSPLQSPELAKGFVDALGRSEVAGVGADLGKVLPSLTPGVRAEAVRILLSRGTWSNALLDGIEKGSLSASDLSLDQKQGLLAHPTKSIAARARKVFAKSGGLPNPDRQKVVDELTALTKETGDPEAGKALFKTHCAKCHTHSGEGAKIGPDLTGMAVHPKLHLLTEIMDPNRSVEGNYRQWVAVLKSGKVLQGLLASESKTAVELVDTEAKQHVLQREDIEELTATPKSLMPEGFEKQLKKDELVNLLEFLTKKGRYLPIALDKVATAVSTKGMFISEKSPIERLVFPSWGVQTFQGVPFQLVDPRGDKVPNVILFYGPNGYLAPKMPRSVELPLNAPAKSIHLLSGVAGWAYPYSQESSVCLTVRLHYADGTTEDHALKNGQHFADYIRRVDVPGSKFAFALGKQQIRYLAIEPKRSEEIRRIEFVRSNDVTAPVVMAVTVEFPQ